MLFSMVSIFTIEKESESLLLNNLYINVLSLMVMLKFKKLLQGLLMFNLKFKFLQIYLQNRSFKFFTIIYGTKIINKMFCRMKVPCLYFIRRNQRLQNSSSYKYKKRFFQKGAGQIVIGIPMNFASVTFPTLKQQFSIR